MANKNKKSKETIYRAKNGTRWRFVEDCPNIDCWLMARVKDGHRLFVDPKDVTIEK